MSDGSLAAGTALAINEVTTIELAAGNTYSAQGGVLDMQTSVGSIQVGGAGTVTVSTSNDNAIQLADIVDAGDSNKTDLSVSGSGNVNLASINLNDATVDGDLALSLDTEGNGVRTLDTAGGLLNVGLLSITGVGGDDQVTLGGDVVASGAVTANVLDRLELPDDVDIIGGSIDLTNGVAAVSLEGITSNVLRATAGDILASDITSNAAELVLNATGAVTVGSFAGGGDLRVLDSDSTAFNGAVTAGTVTLSDSSKRNHVQWRYDHQLAHDREPAL
ncbi:MAG: hypothetical protein U5O39_19020 [Gammaproteobacteria bacterium]|nr:hypothetical protein [Gammaproteobacteria bacterium]